MTYLIHKLHPTWIWSKKLTRFIRSKCIGYTLHVCSGSSQLGDIRLDLYEKADIHADLEHLPFKPLSFDTCIIDPPFSYYKRMKWVTQFARIARRRIIMITPMIVPYFQRFALAEAYLVRDHPGHVAKHCLIYDRKDYLITDFIY